MNTTPAPASWFLRIPRRLLAAGLGVLLCLCLSGGHAYGQLVRVPTKAETRKKQKEYSGKRNEPISRSAQPAPSNNPLGRQMTRQSMKRSSGKGMMMVPVRRPQDAIDVNNPRNINLNKQPAEQPLASRNPMGMAMAKQSFKANKSAKGLLVPGPAYRKKMMERRSSEFAAFRGEKNTLALPYRKKMYKERAAELASFRKGNTLRPEYRKQMYRRKSKELSSYKGDMLVRKRPKGAYPNLTYRGGRTGSSFEKKEKYRKRLLKRMGDRKYVPPHLRRKDEKPRYDSRESEIWEKPR